MIHIVEKNLDNELRARWELVVGDNHFPKLTEFVEFLQSAEIYPIASPSIDELNQGYTF